MFAQFRSYYPTGSLISELLQIHQDNYLVRASVQVGGVTIATGMAAASTIELAEDRARERAIALLGITPATPVPFSPLTPHTPNPQILTEGNVSPGVVLKDQKLLATEKAGLPSNSFPNSDTYPPTPNTLSSNSLEDGSADYTNNWESSNSNGIASPYTQEIASKTATSNNNETWSAGNYEETNGFPGEPQDDTSKLMDEGIDEWPKLNNSINVELERLGWKQEQEEGYLKRIYGKRSRPMLTNTEAKEFLEYLQTYHQTEIELKQRLGWDDAKGREYLERTYGKNKKSRAQLNCEELKEFLVYLQSQPTPNENLF